MKGRCAPGHLLQQGHEMRKNRRDVGRGGYGRTGCLALLGGREEEGEIRDGVVKDNS